MRLIAEESIKVAEITCSTLANQDGDSQGGAVDLRCLGVSRHFSQLMIRLFLVAGKDTFSAADHVSKVVNRNRRPRKLFVSASS